MPPKTESRAAYSVWKLSFVTGFVVKSVFLFWCFCHWSSLRIVFVAFTTRKVNTWTERFSMKAQINMNRLKSYVKKLNSVLVHEQFHQVSTWFTARPARKNPLLKLRGVVVSSVGSTVWVSVSDDVWIFLGIKEVWLSGTTKSMSIWSKSSVLSFKALPHKILHHVTGISFNIGIYPISVNKKPWCFPARNRKGTAFEFGLFNLLILSNPPFDVGRSRPCDPAQLIKAGSNPCGTFRYFGHFCWKSIWLWIRWRGTMR